MIKLQSNPQVLIADLVELARNYGWNGDYNEVVDFVQWSIEQVGDDPTKYELEAYGDCSSEDKEKQKLL